MNDQGEWRQGPFLNIIIAYRRTGNLWSPKKLAVVRKVRDPSYVVKKRASCQFIMQKYGRSRIERRNGG